MNEISYRNRRAFRAENENVRVTVTVEGGHIAEIFQKASGVNPLWTPPWPSIEPSAYSLESHPEYGSTAESYILSGLMGHSICLDTYGAPSAEEGAAGMPVHGEGPVASYAATGQHNAISLTAVLPLAQLRFEREIRLSSNGSGDGSGDGSSNRSVVQVRESIENLASSDRPIAWTQHVTLGPPFLEPGRTEFRVPATRSKVIDADFGGAQKTGAEFTWPFCPRQDGGVIDLRVYPGDATSAGFTTHLLDAGSEHGYFIAWSPTAKVVFGYVWKREDFPWFCRWEENHSRSAPPWNGRTVACGMEFSASPTVESRREMVTRGSLYGVPAYRWLPAKSRIETAYCGFIDLADSIPESVAWDGKEQVHFF